MKIRTFVSFRINGFLLRKIVFNGEQGEVETIALGDNISDTIDGGMIIYSIFIVLSLINFLINNFKI